MSLLVMVLVILVVAVVAFYLVGQLPDASMQAPAKIIVAVLCLVWLLLELVRYHAIPS